MIRFKQRGGTVLGFILGIIVGLAAATAVAVYVTKVPVPFIHKGATRSSDQDAAEAAKNRNWNPNASLRGRSLAVAPADLPAGGAASAPNSTSAATPVAMATQITPATEGKPARPAARDPLGEFASARAGAQSAAAAVEQAPYFVQAGAFTSPADAEAQRARLSLIGVPARVSAGDDPAGRAVYRVRVGPLQDKDSADRVKQQLADNDFSATLVRAPR